MSTLCGQRIPTPCRFTTPTVRWHNSGTTQRLTPGTITCGRLYRPYQKRGDVCLAMAALVRTARPGGQRQRVALSGHQPTEAVAVQIDAAFSSQPTSTAATEFAPQWTPRCSYRAHRALCPPSLPRRTRPPRVEQTARAMPRRACTTVRRVRRRRHRLSRTSRSCPISPA